MPDIQRASWHSELTPWVSVGPWLLRERRDQGSFGVVFRVERLSHPEAGLFALKVALRPDDPRFAREVTLLQRTPHSNIPRFEDQGRWKNSEARLGATRRIVPSPAAAETDQASRPGPPRKHPVPAWLSAIGAAIAGGLLVFTLMAPERKTVTTEVPPSVTEHVEEAPTPETPDGGVGEEAFASVVRIPRDVVPYTTVGTSMPKQPFPGQKKPPCDPDVEVPVLGACWSLLKKESPCGPTAFDYQGKCLRAVFEGARQPTTEEPR